MKITYRGDYALKSMLDLAIHYNIGIVTIHDLASRIDAPIKFLEQVLLDLKRGGFVESRRGKVGGYLLAKPPAQITMGEVVRFIDGPLEPISCLEKGYAGCGDTYNCIFRRTLQKVGQAISDIVDHLTFEDLANQLKAAKREPSYSI